MFMPSPGPTAFERKSWLGYFAAFMLHTCVAYACAIHLSAWLVFHWFGWIMPILHVWTSTPATDWYLQHLELMTILPALMVGYLNVARFLPNTIRNFMHEGHQSIATWAWILPTLVLGYKMLEYQAPWSSVLYERSSMTAMKYFFDIVRLMPVMPTQRLFFASDPIRVWAQMSVTAPFYAGVAYSLGALAWKYRLGAKLFRLEKHDETVAQRDSAPTPEG
jgi:hypothetical protein